MAAKRQPRKRRAPSTSPAPARQRVAVTDEDRARKRRATLSSAAASRSPAPPGTRSWPPRQDSDGENLPAAYFLERTQGLLPWQSYILTLGDLCRFLGRCGTRENSLELPAWNAQTWDPVLVDYLESRYDLGRAKEACTRTV